jgi:hypothetical protein
MHEIIDQKFYLGPKFGTLINKKWITISELLQQGVRRVEKSSCQRQEFMLSNEGSQRSYPFVEPLFL